MMALDLDIHDIAHRLIGVQITLEIEARSFPGQINNTFSYDKFFIRANKQDFKSLIDWLRSLEEEE